MSGAVNMPTDTMPNPVAEVVARLRARASCQREDGWEISREGDPTLLENAADLLERLSRERDTGVPEGFWLAPNEPTREMEHAYIKAYDAICAVSDQYDDPFKWFEAGYNAVRAAAPQPPTVSPDIVALTRERDQAREALAPFAKVLDAMEHDNQLCEEEIDSVLAGTGIVPSDLRRARSVLDPEKEEKA